VPEGPSGSGCTPGDAVLLPEGEWFGQVVNVSASGIEFDLACWFTGEAAIDAAAEDGAESPPPNDYYVRNDNALIRSLPVPPDVEVTWYPTGDPTSEATVTFAEWVDEVPAGGPFNGVWLDVIDDEVRRIREQWVP
jgi:NADPH-dependent ferric siderophore reductase